MRAWAWALLAACGGDPAVTEPALQGDPGQVTARRLNRAEYNHVVRDLLGTAQTPADRFPADDFGYGFSNIADVLSVSATHVDLYQQAAEDLLAELTEGRPAPTTAVRLEGEAGEGAGVARDAVRSLWTAGSVGWTVLIPEDGAWSLAVEGSAEAGAVARLAVDDREVGSWDLAGGSAGVVETLAAGPHAVTLWLDNPGAADAGAAPTLHIDAVTLVGPLGQTLPAGPGRARVFACDPAAIGEPLCAEQIVRGFGRRAWRRPLTEDEFDRLMTLYAASRNSGGDWEEGVLLALQGILLAPQFVYRIEGAADAGDPTPRPLDDWELASRLSFFLWSSIPDDTLLSLAEQGVLRDPAVLLAQVDRMLADPKASALVDTLGVEWLYLAAVDESAPDTDVFPAFGEPLRASMKAELALFTADVLLGDRSMLDLVTSTDTFVDPALAEHYGVAPPSASGFARVSLPDRPGILGRAGWLTAVSYPTRTSPVRRGKWVLENLMCEAPPPPPPGVVAALPADGEDTGVTASIREQFEQHRADPACAGCHIPMDGIGFGLEGFDAIGRSRTVDAYGNPIDASGSLATGASFVGPSELSAMLAADPKVPRCMTQKVFTFALGRPPRVEDLDYLDAIQAEFAANGLTFRALARAIVRSEPFRWRSPAVEEVP